MDTKEFEIALKKAKENSKKRNFKQSVDFIIGFKHLDLKKPENHLDFYLQLHYDRGRPVKTCALVGPELLDQAKKECTTVISVDDFDKYLKDPKASKKLAENHDYFIAQATIMPKVAATFGKVLGTRGKMPNPKAGCVVPPNANLKQLVAKLSKTVRVMVKKDPLYQINVGLEDQDEKQLIDNIVTVYNQIVSHLSNGIQNIKSVYLKLTMGKCIKVGEEEVPEEEPKKKKKESKEQDKEEETKDSEEKK